MKYLLPYHFKKIGLLITPLGILFWLLMQKGFFSDLLINQFNKQINGNLNPSYQIINVLIAVISIFCFLIGIYFIAFSKEKTEDELVQRTRLESFQFAAIFQIILLILGFIVMILTKEPRKDGFILFFFTCIFLFWIIFIIRFNYLFHFKLKNEK